MVQQGRHEGLETTLPQSLFSQLVQSVVINPEALAYSVCLGYLNEWMFRRFWVFLLRYLGLKTKRTG